VPLRVWDRVRLDRGMPVGTRMGMNEWPDYDFIVGEHGEANRASTELTGWEDVRFELADEEPVPEA